MLCVALAALPAMLVAGRLADVFGARLVPVFLVFFGAVEWLPGLAHSVSMLVLFLAVIGIGTGLMDIGINAHAARLEALHGTRIMDGLHAAFSGGVLVGGIGSGLLRRAGAHPVWILAVVGLLTALTAVANLGHSSPAVSGLGPGLFAGAMVTGRVLAQKAEWRAVARRMLVAGLASAAGLALAATSQHAAAALTGFVVAGLGLAVSAPTLFGLAGRVGGEGGRGSALSTVAILGYLGFVAGPALIGAVSGASSLRGGLLFLCGVAVILAACAPILRRVVREIGS